MTDGNDPDELRGCKGIVIGLVLGGTIWLLIIFLIWGLAKGWN